MKKMKLFPKTFLYTLLLFCFMNLIIHLSIYCFYPYFYLKNMDKQLEEKMDILEKTLPGLDEDTTAEVLSSFARENSVNILVQADKESKTYQGLPFPIAAPFQMDQFFSLEGVEKVESVIVQSSTITYKDGTSVDLQILASSQPLKEATRIITFLLPFTLGIAVLCSVVFSYFYSRKVTDPILNMLNEIAQLEKSKADFLRSASHELKTPLTGLRILLENMQYNVGKYKDHEKYLAAAVSSVDQLSDMVREILDASRIQGTAAEAAKDVLYVREELEEIMMNYTLIASSRSLTVDLKVASELQLYMNRSFFQQVWSNLLGNAVRYTDAGGHISMESHSIGTHSAELRIRNTCQPLTEEQLSHIFEAFYRPDFSRASETGGSGLGLYIIKEILDANHLACRFESCEDGMCFRMSLVPDRPLD